MKDETVGKSVLENESCRRIMNRFVSHSKFDEIGIFIGWPYSYDVTLDLTYLNTIYQDFVELLGELQFIFSPKFIALI